MPPCSLTSLGTSALHSSYLKDDNCGQCQGLTIVFCSELSKGVLIRLKLLILLNDVFVVFLFQHFNLFLVVLEVHQL